MATLTLTCAANNDDVYVMQGGSGSGSPLLWGGTGSPMPTGGGVGLSFPSATLVGADTINSAYVSMMKSGAQFITVSVRLAVVDEDNRGSFTTSSPNRPGDPAIVAGTIPDTSDNISYSDGARYEWPRAADTTGRANLGTLLAAVFDRGGWASGNSVCVVCNSAQDASAYTTTARINVHSVESATASSEPQLVIDYTAAAAGAAPPPPFRPNRVTYRTRRF